MPRRILRRRWRTTAVLLALVVLSASASCVAASAQGAQTLAPTPYMGWDTYFAFGPRISEAIVLEQASELLARGLLRDGYRYIWLDVGWWQGQRSANGQIVVNRAQWPHGMNWLTQHTPRRRLSCRPVHRRGQRRLRRG